MAQLRQAPWNPKKAGTDDEIRNLAESMRSSKSAGCLTVRELPTDKGADPLYEIIDGNHRLPALAILGWDEVDAHNYGRISKAQAAVLSRQRREWFDEDREKWGELLRDEIVPVFEPAALLDILPDTAADLNALVTPIEPLPVDTGADIPAADQAVHMTAEQYGVVMQAVELIREEGPMSDGRALELICAEFLATH